MFDLLVQLVVAPLLVAAASVAARRWGHAIGGLVSAFPAIVGPVLLIGAHRHGVTFAAQQATAILAGLSGLGAFALVYGRTAVRSRWRASVAAGWAAAALATVAAGAAGASLLAALAVAVASLVVAHRGLPRPVVSERRLEPPRWDLALRMSLTALLVVALAAAAGAVGPTAGGLLAALPVLTCILAAFAHQSEGGAAATQLLRGTLRGMAGFVVFCLLVAALVETAGIAVTFTAAAVAALVSQAAIGYGFVSLPLLIARGRVGPG